MHRGRGFFGRAGTVLVVLRWSQQGQAGGSPSRFSGPVSLSTCHIQVRDARGVGTTQVRIQPPPRCPTVAEHLPMLGTTRAPNPPEPVLYLIMTWQGWVPGCFYNPPWAPTARVWLPWKCRQLTKSSHKARPRCTPCALAQTQFPRLGMPLECQGSPLAMLLGTRAPGASPARARKRRRCPQFLPRVRRHRSSPGSAARS